MKIPDIIQTTRDTLRHLALAAALGVALTAPASAAPPVSGYVHWFDASTLGLANADGVTAWPDGGSSGGNATVPSGNATPVYVANAGTETGLGAVYFAKNGGAGNSAALKFTRDTAIRTVFSVFKGNAFLLTDFVKYNFHRPGDDNPTDPLIANHDAGPIVAGQTYVNGVLVDPENDNMPTDVHNGFNLVTIVTDGNPVNADSFNKDRVYHAGNQYQAEVIIYDTVLDEADRLAVEQYLYDKWFNPGLTVNVTVPANGSAYLVGATIPATATVASGTAPYSVEFFLDSGSGFVTQGTDPDSPYTVNLTGLAIGSYSIKATVTDGTAATDESTPITFTVSNTGPTNLAAVPGNQLVNLSWNQVLGATGYKVLRSSPTNGSYSEIATGVTDLTYQDTGLTNGVTYYYVVQATVGTTVSDPSNEVSSAPSEVDPGLSTVVGYLPEVWSDGTATSTVTVTLRNGGGLVVEGKNVTLAASGTAGILPLAPAFATTDSNGVATFTVTCTTPGTQQFTATAATSAGALAITQTGRVLFKTKPADLTVYVPANLPTGGVVNVLKTWDATSTPLWTDWTNWEAGSFDIYGNKVLGGPAAGGPRGAMYINDVRNVSALATMSFYNSGLEVTYIGAIKRVAGDAATYAEMLNMDNPRQGFIVEAPGGSGSTGDSVQTWQMRSDGSNRVENWSDLDLDGLHVMTLLRLSNGDVQTYVDGVLTYTMTGTVDPTVPLKMLAFGYEFSGNHYIQPGSIVEQVKAFTVSYPVGAPDAGTSTVVASPATMIADGIGTSTVTVTLKDAAGNRVADKEVTLSYTGPGAVTFTPSASTTGVSGVAVFTVQPTTTTAGIYEFTATVTDPAVVITQKAALNTTLIISTTALNVSESGTGLEILNDGSLVEANHFGPTGIGDVTVHDVLFGTSWDHMTSGWNTGGQWTNSDEQGLVPSLTDATDFGKLMREYIWTGAGNTYVDIPGLTAGHTYRLQWITSSPRGGNIAVEGSASVPLTGNSDAPTVLTFIWQATDTSANILVTRQNNPHYGGSHDSEIVFNGYALHDMGGGSGGGGYADWAALYADNGPADGDANNDGVQNGIAYFMGENGVTTNPGVVGGKVSWKKAGGDAYVVKVSDDLQNWSDAPVGSVNEVDGYVVFDVLTNAKRFARLEVMLP